MDWNYSLPKCVICSSLSWLEKTNWFISRSFFPNIHCPEHSKVSTPSGKRCNFNLDDPPPSHSFQLKSLFFFFLFFTKLLISCQKQLSFTLMSSQSYYSHNCHITSILYVTLKNIFFYVTVKFLFEWPEWFGLIWALPYGIHQIAFLKYYINCLCCNNYLIVYLLICMKISLKIRNQNKIIKCVL